MRSIEIPARYRAAAKRSVVMQAKRRAYRALRGALIRYVRAQPREDAGAGRRVTILIASAWGMGGTIRAAHNQAKYLAAHGYDVELLSVKRSVEEPFFGAFPPGVRASALDDRRPGAVPRPLRPLRKTLRRVPSVLMHRADRRERMWNLWTDIKVVHALRGRTGFLVATRPGLNILAADLSPPGMTVVGLEQMNLGHHAKALRKGMARSYGGLDALVALTEQDRQAYENMLDGRVRLEVIPNTVHDVSGPAADLDSRTILAAGRLVRQKGYDMLIDAFAPVHAAHPDWRLKICGGGELKDVLAAQVAERGLEGAVELAGPCADLPGEMERASIYALSSRFEGFPLVLLEAMGKGMAVVAFDCPTGPRDIIEDGVNGALVPPKDVDAFAARLRAMIEDEELRRRCGPAAAETAKQYTIDVIGPRWEALFRDLA
jgi:glycosyltransferase involved in cell wall biosynthesis